LKTVLPRADDTAAVAVHHPNPLTHRQSIYLYSFSDQRYM